MENKVTMSKKQMRSYFEGFFKGKINPVTPRVLNYYEVSPSIVAELSTGDRISGSRPYSVTVIEIDEGEFIDLRRELCYNCHSKIVAEAYISLLISMSENDTGLYRFKDMDGGMDLEKTRDTLTKGIIKKMEE